MKEIKKCSICGSTTRIHNSPLGLLCGKHYCQYKRHGKILERTKYDPNEIILKEDHAVIVLYNNKSEPIAEALIDIEDVDKIKAFKWCKDKNGYVKNSNNVYLHRLIKGEIDLFVDHINGNKLDNRKINLRVCTNADNLKNRVKLPSSNTSGILGVRYRKDRNKWYAELQCNNIKHNLGSYLTKEEAIKARLDAEIKYFGEYKSKVLNNETN